MINPQRLDFARELQTEIQLRVLRRAYLSWHAAPAELALRAAIAQNAVSNLHAESRGCGVCRAGRS